MFIGRILFRGPGASQYRSALGQIFSATTAVIFIFNTLRNLRFKGLDLRIYLAFNQGLPLLHSTMSHKVPSKSGYTQVSSP